MYFCTYSQLFVFIYILKQIHVQYLIYILYNRNISIKYQKNTFKKIKQIHLLLQNNIMITTPSKRQLFHSQIRNKQINIMLNKIRLRITKQDRLYVLNNMIQQIQQKQSINAKQLMLLIKWASQGCAQAVVVMGNFFIDAIIDKEIYKQCQGKSMELGKWGWLGTSQFCLWFVHILYEKNCFSQVHLMYLVNTLCERVSMLKLRAALETITVDQYMYQHGLLLVRKIFRYHTLAVQLLLQPQNKQITQNLLKSLFTLCQSGLNGKIIQTILSILGSICFISSSGFKQDYLVKLVKICKCRQESKIRSLCYQILTNYIAQKQNICSHQFIQEIASLIHTLVTQKKSVQLQLTYLITKLIQKLQIPIIQQLICKQDLIIILIHVLKTTSHNQIIVNCLQILSHFKNIRFQLIQNRTITQLEKFWYLESQFLDNMLIKWRNNQLA